MKSHFSLSMFLVCAALILDVITTFAQSTNATPYPIDLSTALRLAGAQNLDVQIAREQLKEAEAKRSSALEKFFPWLNPGIGYHRRDGEAQAVPSGVISDAHYQSYAPGAALTAQMELGDAIYSSLSAKQVVRATDQALQAQREDAALAAAQAYFELAKAKALVGVVTQAIEISRAYQQQLHVAVTAGIAFKGDELRVQTQTEHYEVTLQQALEQQRVAGSSLAVVLHLDSRTELVPQEVELVPIILLETNSSMDSLVNRALEFRPELKQTQSLIAAAKETHKGARYGPLIPNLGAQVYGGGFGGGPDGGPSHFGAAGDYTVGLSWRIGPGGLFDQGRINASKAQLATVQLSELKLKDAIVSEVVSSLARMRSTSAQIELAKKNLETATETLRLTRERKQFGVGVVLEDIEAQQALNQARSDYVTAVAEFNKAQFALDKAVGGQTANKPVAASR